MLAIPLSDRLISRFEVLFPAALVLAGAISICASLFVGLKLGALSAIGALGLWIAMSAWHRTCYRAAGDLGALLNEGLPQLPANNEKTTALPYSVFIVVDYSRWSASMCVFSFINIAISYIAPMDVAGAPLRIRLVYSAALIMAVSVATGVGYVRREFFDVSENAVAHRYYSLFGTFRRESVPLFDARFQLVNQRLQIEGSTSSLSIPLSRVSKPLEFLHVLRTARACARVQLGSNKGDESNAN